MSKIIIFIILEKLQKIGSAFKDCKYITALVFRAAMNFPFYIHNSDFNIAQAPQTNYISLKRELKSGI